MGTWNSRITAGLIAFGIVARTSVRAQNTIEDLRAGGNW
jgi:hypothetical protein